MQTSALSGTDTGERCATYRLPLGPGLGVDGARALVPYLRDLGVSHLRVSPLPDHDDPGLRALADAAYDAGLGLMLDPSPPGRLVDPAGHEFAVDVQALFVDPAGELPLTELQEELGDGALRRPALDARRFSVSVEDFHAASAARAACAREQALATTTTNPRDTLLAADGRARLGSLASMGEEWAGAVRRWRADNAALREACAEAGPAVPTPAEELLVYQTLVAAWPVEADRLEPSSCLLAALRTAKQEAGETGADAAREAAVLGFARTLLDHGPFRYGFDGWAMRVAEAGGRAALGQTLLKLTVPGTPDFDPGDEDWFLTPAPDLDRPPPADWAVRAAPDPNRLPRADWAVRQARLTEVRNEAPGAPAARERAKLRLVVRLLALRARRPEALAGPYTPIPAGDQVVAFLRGDDVLVAVAVRDPLASADDWELPPAAAGRWRDVLTGAEFVLPEHASLTAVLGPEGRAALERVG